MTKKTVDSLYEHFLKIKKYDKIPIEWISANKNHLHDHHFELFREYWPDEAESELDEERCNISHMLATNKREY